MGANWQFPLRKKDLTAKYAKKTKEGYLKSDLLSAAPAQLTMQKHTKIDEISVFLNNVVFILSVK